MQYRASAEKFHKKNTKKIKFDKPKSDAAKRAWRKLRLLVKFWSFPRLYYTREYNKMARLRKIILDFEQENWLVCSQQIEDSGLVLAPKSLRAIWYDSNNFNIVYDSSILDSYQLQGEASSEQIFIESTQDRASSIHVSRILLLQTHRKKL